MNCNGPNGSSKVKSKSKLAPLLCICTKAGPDCINNGLGEETLQFLTEYDFLRNTVCQITSFKVTIRIKNKGNLKWTLTIYNLVMSDFKDHCTIRPCLPASFLKIIQTMSCWYSLDSPHWVLSDEYPDARVSTIFQVFCSILYCTN